MCTYDNQVEPVCMHFFNLCNGFSKHKIGLVSLKCGWHMISCSVKSYFEILHYGAVAISRLILIAYSWWAIICCSHFSSANVLHWRFPGSLSVRIWWFYLSYMIVNEKPLGFGLLVGRNKQFEDVTLGTVKLWWAFFTSICIYRPNHQLWKCLAD